MARRTVAKHSVWRQGRVRTEADHGASDALTETVGVEDANADGAVNLVEDGGKDHSDNGVDGKNRHLTMLLSFFFLVLSSSVVKLRA